MDFPRGKIHCSISRTGHFRGREAARGQCRPEKLEPGHRIRVDPGQVPDSVYPVPEASQYDKDGYPVYQQNQADPQTTPQTYSHKVQATWDGVGYQFKDIYGRAWRYSNGKVAPVQAQ